jgi:cytochrome c oxidase subunit II
MRASRPTLRWVLPAGLALLAAGCTVAGVGGDTGELPQNALDPAGPIARMQDDLWTIVFWIAVGVFVLVQGGILYTVFRFRDRGGDDLPPQIHGNTRLEILWTIIPALILVGIAVPTVAGIFALAEEPGDDALQVRVIGKQYWWEFEYLGDEGQGVVTANELHIPAGRPIRLELISQSASVPDGVDGVIHSFWVPRLAGKADVVPGHVRYLTIEADEPGTYPGQCAEFCGLSHSRMRFLVIAHDAGDFAAWLDSRAQPAHSPGEGLAVEGEAVFEEAACINCHALDGHPADSGIRIGPDLTHFASRGVFAGGIFDNDDEEQLRAWLADPPGVKAGAQMPDLGLTDEQIQALIAYLQTLE